MLQSGEWPTNMQYITCDDYDGLNTPERNINLRSAFMGVSEPSTYGNLTFPTGSSTPFNGHTWMKFNMEISAVSVQGGTSVSTKPIGNWTADISAPIHVNSHDEISNMTAAVVYRIFTVEVSSQYWTTSHLCKNSNLLELISIYSKRPLSLRMKNHQKVSKDTVSI